MIVIFTDSHDALEGPGEALGRRLFSKVCDILSINLSIVKSNIHIFNYRSPFHNTDLKKVDRGAMATVTRDAFSFGSICIE
jgi:hypothetical protein